jgi:hypothetical protein
VSVHPGDIDGVTERVLDGYHSRLSLRESPDFRGAKGDYAGKLIVADSQVPFGADEIPDTHGYINTDQR